MTWHQARILLRVLLLSCLCLAGLAILFTVALVVVTSIGGATGLCRVSVGIDNGRSQFVDCGGPFQAVYKADTFAVSEPIPEFVGPFQPATVTSCYGILYKGSIHRTDGAPMADPFILPAAVWFGGFYRTGAFDPESMKRCQKRSPLSYQPNGHRWIDSRLRLNGVTYVKCDGVHVVCRNVGPQGGNMKTVTNRVGIDLTAPGAQEHIEQLIAEWNARSAAEARAQYMAKP